MLTRLPACIASAIALLIAFGRTPAYSQAYAIYLSAEINTNLPTTNFGGGGPFNQESGSDTPIIQTAAGLVPMFHSDYVSALDPCANDLGSAWAQASVSDVSVYNSTLYVAVSTSGGMSASPCLGANGEAIGNAQWTDTLYISGLPAGTPVKLKITDVFDGGFHVTGLAEGNSALYHGIQVIDQQCGSACNVSPDTSYSTSQNISYKKTYILQAYSGDTLGLTNVINAVLGAGGQSGWTGSAASNAARIYVDPENPRVVITSASQLDYSTPGSSGPNAVPSIIGESQSLAAAAIQKAGLIVGTVSKQSSITVAANTIISQNPAPGTTADMGTAVDFVLSTGPIRGDVNFDGQVDSLDVQLIQEALGAPATGPNDPRDLNHDGTIDAADVRIDKSLCTYTDCATSAEAEAKASGARKQ